MRKTISIGITFFLIISGLLGTLSLIPMTARGTIISGLIFDGAGGPLTEAESPYIVMGDIIVPQGETLTIEPGAQVKFDADCFIYIDGTLLAQGSESNRIIIESNDTDPGIGRWMGIQVNSTGHAEIKYCNISHTDGAVRLFSSSNVIMNNSITYNWAGIDLSGSSYNIIANNSFSRNLWMGIDFGSYSTNNIISNNNISDTYGGFGISLSSYCHNNSFLNNDLWYNWDGVSSDWRITNITFNGNSICHSRADAIDLRSSNSTVINNYVENNSRGIEFWDTSGNNIFNNTLINNSYGIDLYSTTDCLITGNNIIGNNYGIYLWSGSDNNTIMNNNVISNKQNGIDLYKSSNNLIIKNNITSNKKNGLNLRIGLFNTTILNNVISSNNQNGIRIASSSNSTDKICSNNKIFNNTIFNNSIGISLNATTSGAINNIEILNSTIYENDVGISFKSTSNNSDGPLMNITVENCSIEINRIGIEMIGILNGSNVIKYNNITNNYDYAINVTNSSFNLIYHNNFVNNGAGTQVYDDSNVNMWNYSYPIGGNFWSDYIGVDFMKGPKQDQNGSDKIGDTPYFVELYSFDHYPLMEPSILKPLENITRLKKGWNLISLPLIQQNQSIVKVLEMIDGWYDALQWYDILDSSDSWKHNKIGKPLGNDLFELTETMSFWIHITQPGDTIFVYNGTQPTSNQTIPIHKGWNMVGYPSLSSHNRTSGLNNLTFDTHIDAIQWYDAATMNWHFMGPDDTFVPGRGYWVHSKVEAEWEVLL